MVRRGADKALADLIKWSQGNEPDSYPYFKDFFCTVLDYPKDKVRINESGFRGFPDVTLFSKDGDRIAWVVCEVKPEPGFFRTDANQQTVWTRQLKRYVTADTVHCLLLDPTALVVMTPNGHRILQVDLDAKSVRELTDPSGESSLSFLSFDNSTGSVALGEFVSGNSAMHYLDVSVSESRESFYNALRLSASELRNYALARVHSHMQAYEDYKKKKTALEQVGVGQTPRMKEQMRDLKREYRSAIQLREEVIEHFADQMGREVPSDPDEQENFIQKVYAAEAANLVLARILFVRFFEDYDLTTRKISNGGVAQFRTFHRYIKNDYRYLLDNAFRDMKSVYARLFEESVFDWAHNSNGELSQVLLRIFYRLNAFDFKLITGDVLGNLYERFLDPKSRKEMGEFYTPQFVADYILQGIGFRDRPGPILDPACGSGTFLFRAIELSIDHFRRKGISHKDAIEQAVRIVHGLDINIFAAFIAQLQVIWHLLPHFRAAGISRIPDLNIYGGLDSLESGSRGSLDEHLITSREDAASRIRDNHYQYVVGNPPYIRAERMKGTTRWSEYYSDVATGKKDAAFFFLYRAIEGGKIVPPWLEENGSMGFIVSFGVADSKAAEALRGVLLRHTLLELVDLEALSNEVFTSGIATSRSTVAPIIIMASRTGVEVLDYGVRVTSATRTACLTGDEVDLGKSLTSVIPKSVFLDTTINPFRQFTTKLQSGDLSILRKLLSNKKLADFAQPLEGKKIAIQVGIRHMGGGKISSEPGEGRLPMAKGTHVHSFALNSSQVSEYVELKKVDNLMLWKRPSLIGKPAYLLSELGFAPQACSFDSSKFIAQKSCIIFVPRNEYSQFPWDVYLNSRIPRFVFALVLRSALLEGTEDIWRAHINVEAVKLFPFSEEILTCQNELISKADTLRELATSILSRWQSIDENIKKSHKTTLALVPNIRYEGGSDFKIFKSLKVEYSEAGGIARLQPFWRNQPTFDYIEGDSDALQVTKYMMDHPEFNLTPEPGAEIPREYAPIAEAIRNAVAPDSPDVSRFKDILEDCDEIIADALSLTGKEKTYIKTRLQSAPFQDMQPRWPWTPADVRETRIYDEDRYA